MKLKKIIAAVAAAAVAVSTMAINAFADDTYHAYLGVQTNPSWIFRNAWNDKDYGTSYEAFNKLSQDGAPADIAGTFTDVEITGDGTYKVSLTGADLSSEEKFSLLFVSTDIPLDAGVSITNVKVIIDGQTKYTFDEAFLSPDDKEYMNILARNIWNDDLGGDDGLFGYTMPNDSVEMEFTVSGLGGGAAAADTAETSTTTETTSPTTGNTPAAVMLTVMAVAGTAAVVSKKRK
ncbi:MAG: hypothetical protein NC253_08055 [Ruminococcus sp.]|nr:hypothetical protein [Ruminococcus sp.]MCM1380640.1 hypothetical protein [Muribaculaceae bacterium]MCM1478184.1 hypothetical protein [Muribaculaceae bacterium]